MSSTPLSASQPATASEPTDSRRGKGLAATVYVLFLGSIMTVITAPIGVLIAHLCRRRSAGWVGSHLQFQIRTFWLGALAGVAALAAWNLLGLIGAPSWVSWTLGYGFFTACLGWTIGRCGVGINRLMNNQAIAAPRSLLFGGAAVTLDD
ncbi:hypothetical protein HOP52_03750 [Halomonas campisalis]|uniref:Uncharacterized protein n=1 Tax=Billgrantia campisalis TaxID=74661 RepID=A0ABS9P536_9GAMM|nr:hypothetical protein [Halomonas campisalis]MCG6656893.1 hypothetical protein [Halomonas campisalis]MDR5862082.1 hypothetical protein [Halomonas campisalis]